MMMMMMMMGLGLGRSRVAVVPHTQTQTPEGHPSARLCPVITMMLPTLMLDHYNANAFSITA
jgi:hypothetical protein